MLHLHHSAIVALGWAKYYKTSTILSLKLMQWILYLKKGERMSMLKVDIMAITPSGIS